jgi:hypothetical protein
MSSSSWMTEDDMNGFSFGRSTRARHADGIDEFARWRGDAICCRLAVVQEQVP